MNNITEFARWYCEHNIPVHPLKKGTKIPLLSKWHEAAIPNLAELDKKAPEWGHKGYGLGIRAGYPLSDSSVLLVVDVDTHAGALTPDAKHELHQQLSSFGLNPTAPNIITGRCPDSCHYYVEAPASLANKLGASTMLCRSDYTNSDNEPYWKIELLGKGKQVVCPPTRHPDTGKEYVMANHNIMIIPTPLIQRVEEVLTPNQKPSSPMASLPPDMLALFKHCFEPAMQSFLMNDEVKIERLKSALETISADCDHDIWRNIVWSIHAHNIINGIDIARNWSIQSPKYQPHYFDTVWNSFDSSGGIGEGTLYHVAKENGWSESLNKVLLQSVPHSSECPCYRVFDSALKHNGYKYSAGVWWFTTDKSDDDEVKGKLICSPIHIESVTCDISESNFGRQLKFINTLKHWRTWSMPMSLLSGYGEPLRENLLSMGVSIRDPKLLMQYLQDIQPSKKMRCTPQVGWCDGVFVLPDCTYGKHKKHEIIFQSEQKPIEEYMPKGSLEDWRDNIAALAVNNPLLTTAICCAFAGPLIELCHAESGGLHFYGDSSTGKTTLVQAACSVWGGANYMRSWQATSNGIVAAATMFNGTLLALDEISECNPSEVGNITYALANGCGKQRASKTGTARPITRWKTSVISSGELTVSATIQESGKRPKAGQSVRLIDIPAQRSHGAWDDLHDFSAGSAFSEHLKKQSKLHYGHVGRSFLERLTNDTQDFSERLHNIMSSPKFNFDTATGQVERVAKRFALLALAGELATEYGLTGWENGAATQAMAEVLQSWLALQGHEPLEKQQAIEQLHDYIERYGDSRFSEKGNTTTNHLIRERAGWWFDIEDERTYFFTAWGLRDALKGHDFNRALDVLRTAGILILKGKKNGSEVMKIDKQPCRIYPIRFPDSLE